MLIRLLNPLNSLVMPQLAPRLTKSWLSDTIEVEDLNLGTDYLINVDQVEFQADSTYIRTIPIISYRENDWIPDISNSVLVVTSFSFDVGV